jgi:D-alanyl-D-alanine carboxypeptidase
MLKRSIAVKFFSFLLCGLVSLEVRPNGLLEPTVCAKPELFCSSIRVLTDQQRKAMIGVVWQPGCPVSLDQLRVVTASHRTFNGSVEQGSLVVHRQHAIVVQQVFQKLFEANFPIQSMKPIENFGGDDERSMKANNTSAFNCRPIKSSKVFSEHAYGRAIDINPLQNPFAKAPKALGTTNNQDFHDRAAVAAKPGVITANSVPVKAFKQIGWGWGGRWRTNKDYQHFSATNR